MLGEERELDELLVKRQHALHGIVVSRHQDAIPLIDHVNSLYHKKQIN